MLLVALENEERTCHLEWFTLFHDSEDMCELQPAVPALSDFTFSAKPTYVSDGSSIYGIGGPKLYDMPTDVYAVDYLDSVCKRLNSMVLDAPRLSSAVCIVQGKIHVLGVYDGSCVVQEYNIKDSDSTRWEHFTISYNEELGDICASFVMLNKIFIKFRWFACVYNPADRTLERYDAVNDNWFESSYCVIGKCLYVLDPRVMDTIHVFDSTSQSWSLLKGMAGKIDTSSFLQKELVALGGRLAIVCSDEREFEISVSVFNLEKINNEYWGNLISTKVVLRPTTYHHIRACLTVAV